jgi:hypothetical protein
MASGFEGQVRNLLLSVLDASSGTRRPIEVEDVAREFSGSKGQELRLNLRLTRTTIDVGTSWRGQHASGASAPIPEAFEDVEIGDERVRRTFVLHNIGPEDAISFERLKLTYGQVWFQHFGLRNPLHLPAQVPQSGEAFTDWIIQCNGPTASVLVTFRLNHRARTDEIRVTRHALQD